MSSLLCFVFLSYDVSTQQAISFEKARQNGFNLQLDSIYKSAIDTDPQKAVFKTDKEIEKHIKAYQDFLINFGAFLKEHNFIWEEQTRGFNRIYISPDGTIDYFLYQLRGLDPAKEAVFNTLLTEYIKTHKFGVTAPVKFAQCSPVTYAKSG